LSDMKQKGELSADEIAILEHPEFSITPYGRAMCMWGWIMRLAQETFKYAEGPPPNGPKLVMLAQLCLNARNSIQTIHTYLHTQLPFAYVHLLTLLVDVTKVMISLKCSVVVFALGFQARPEYQSCLQEIIMLILVPMLYQGLLSISYIIHDPFGEDMLDFPVAAYTQYILESCEAVVRAQSNFPMPMSSSPTSSAHPPSASPRKQPAPSPQVPMPPAPSPEAEPEPFPAGSDTSSLADVLQQISERLACLPHVLDQIKKLARETNTAEVRQNADAEKLIELLTVATSGNPNAAPDQYVSATI